MLAKRIAMVVLTVLLAAALTHAADGLKQGSVELKSAGPIAFGPEGVLFVSDPMAAAVYAIDTKDAGGEVSKLAVNVDKLNAKVAGMLGIAADQVLINDIAVNPASGKVYLSVSRGRGPDAQAVILRVDGAGKITEQPLTNVACAKAMLPNAPEDKVTGSGNRAANNRLFSITDIAFVDNRLIVAGLSNEQFASNLRAIPYPFTEFDTGTSIEIYHGNHAALETRSPIRTFVPISINGDPQIVAAYTCTPLVRIPLSDLKSGEKVRGTTIAELGNRNRPLDIISYQKGGKNFLLMANNARGVMKITTDEIGTRTGITERVAGIAGQPYETIESLKDVTQLDKLGDTHAVILVEAAGVSDLKTIDLP